MSDQSSRPIGPGDVVTDITTNSSFAIERIEDDGIYLNEGEGKLIVINGEWKLEAFPDHEIKFETAPGSLSFDVLAKKPDEQYLLMVELLYDEDNDDHVNWDVMKNSTMTFNSQDEAVEYFLSFGRQVLTNGTDEMEKINKTLSDVWETQIYDRSPADVSERLLYTKQDFERNKPSVFENDDASVTYRVSIVKSSYVPTLQTMVKPAGRR